MSSAHTRRVASPVRLLIAFILLTLILPAAFAQKSQRGTDSAGAHVLWRDPGHIPSRNLHYGPGARHLAPRPPFTFIEEVKSGESPKFRVRDARGVEWSVKLGPEAQ